MAIEIDNENALAFSNISIVYYALNNYEKVKTNLEKATQINYKVLFKNLEEDYLSNKIISRELADIFLSYLVKYKKKFTLKEKKIFQEIKDIEISESDTE